MLDDALRPPRQSFLLGPSTVFCVAARPGAHSLARTACLGSMMQGAKGLVSRHPTRAVMFAYCVQAGAHRWWSAPSS